MQSDTPTPKKKQPWEPMKLTYEGNASQVVQGGGGKLSVSPADPGENRIPKPKT